MHRCARILFAGLFLPVLASAQVKPSFNVQFDIGASRGHTSGPYLSEGGMSASAVLGRDAGRGSNGFVFAISGTAMPMGVATASCDAIPGIPCPQDFPTFWTASAMVGWRVADGALRFLAGPGITSADSRRAGVVHARIDIAKHLSGHVSLLVSPSVIYVPDFRGSSVTLGAFGAGVRLQ